MVVGRYQVTTDDAMSAPTTPHDGREDWDISKVMVGDNARVGAGNVVFMIDDGDYRLAVESARARSRRRKRPSSGSAVRPSARELSSRRRRNWFRLKLRSSAEADLRARKA
jgi:multidrug resistance efflux pump